MQWCRFLYSIPKLENIHNLSFSPESQRSKRTLPNWKDIPKIFSEFLIFLPTLLYSQIRFQIDYFFSFSYSEGICENWILIYLRIWRRATKNSYLSSVKFYLKKGEFREKKRFFYCTIYCKFIWYRLWIHSILARVALKKRKLGSFNALFKEWVN